MSKTRALFQSNWYGREIRRIMKREKCSYDQAQVIYRNNLRGVKGLRRDEKEERIAMYRSLNGGYLTTLRDMDAAVSPRL